MQTGHDTAGPRIDHELIKETVTLHNENREGMGLLAFPQYGQSDITDLDSRFCFR